MRVIVGADDKSPTVDAVVEALRARGVDLKILAEQRWPSMAKAVGEAVAEGRADMGVLFCWTGTGTSMMANKIPGVRAALCWEPWIAQGARKYNDANVLVMSLKRIKPNDAISILDAWFSVEAPDAEELDNIALMQKYERGD